ncbi:MAG: carbohydrate ABC transporter permease [Anaerolineaceae bacterium]|nr:carbohydrate ABC transporter permease [Anaerolineaceae bacterium]
MSEIVIHSSEKKKKKISFGKVSAYVLLTLGALIMIVPFIWMISTSLKDQQQLFAWPPNWLPNPFVWSNYTEVFSRINFGLYSWNTLKITVTVTIVRLIICSMAGYAFARMKFPGRNFLFVLTLATMMISSQITIIPNFIIMRYMDLVNTHLGVILPQVADGFSIFLMRQFFLSFPKELEDAAKLDGCNPLMFYLRILLPSSKPILATLAVMTFQSVWNDFLWPLVMLSSPEKRTLSVGLSYLVGQYTTRWDLQMAGSVLTVLPILILFFILQKYFVQSIKLTGLKG